MFQILDRKTETGGCQVVAFMDDCDVNSCLTKHEYFTLHEFWSYLTDSMFRADYIEQSINAYKGNSRCLMR